MLKPAVRTAILACAPSVPAVVGGVGEAYRRGRSPKRPAPDAESLRPILTENSDGFEGAAVQEILHTELFGTETRANRAGSTVRNDRYQPIEFDNGESAFFDLRVDPMGRIRWPICRRRSRRTSTCSPTRWISSPSPERRSGPRTD